MPKNKEKMRELLELLGEIASDDNLDTPIEAIEAYCDALENVLTARREVAYLSIGDRTITINPNHRQCLHEFCQFTGAEIREGQLPEGIKFPSMERLVALLNDTADNEELEEAEVEDGD